MAESDLTAKLKEAANAAKALRSDVSYLIPPPLSRDEPGPKKVKVHMVLRRVITLDTIKETFGVQFGVRMSWKCPPTEELPVGDTDWEPVWKPPYRICRLMGESVYNQSFSVEEENGEQWVHANFDHLVDVYERLELQSFPMDEQDLCVELRSIAPLEEVQWVALPDAAKLSQDAARKQGEFIFLTDFHSVPECPLTIQLTTQQVEHETVSVMSMHIKVNRRANYYVINVTVSMCILCSFTFCAWASHPADISARFAVDFNLILTAVAFKLLLTGMLPPLSYITLVDVYVVCAFLFLVAATLSHSLLPFSFSKHIDNSPLTLPNWEPMRDVDMIDLDGTTFYVFLAIWILFNVIYFGYAFLNGKKTYAAFIKRSLEEQQVFNEEMEKLSS